MTPGEITRLAILGRLNRSPDHGYNIVKVLTERGLANGTTGAVYRALRDMADQGLVRSYWDTPKAGPAKRTYELTPAGQRYILNGGVQSLRAHVRSVRSVLFDLVTER